MSAKGRRKPQDPAAQAFAEASQRMRAHPLFSPLWERTWTVRAPEGNICPREGWALVTSGGTIYVHPTRRAEIEEWMWVLGHCVLHLGFEHFQKRERQLEWNLACCCFVTRFLDDLKWGRRPVDIGVTLNSLPQSEERIFEALCERGIPSDLDNIGTASPRTLDMSAWRLHPGPLHSVRGIG